MNDSEPVKRSTCNSSDGSLICIDGKCVKNEDMEKDEEGKWAVYIEMNETDLNMTEIYDVIVNIPEFKSMNFKSR